MVEQDKVRQLLKRRAEQAVESEQGDKRRQILEMSVAMMMHAQRLLQRSVATLEEAEQSALQSAETATQTTPRGVGVGRGGAEAEWRELWSKATKTVTIQRGDRNAAGQSRQQKTIAFLLWLRDERVHDADRISELLLKEEVPESFPDALPSSRY